jgi:hypothetical protein
VDELWTAEPPAAHQRRFLVHGPAAATVPSLAEDCARWQQAHIGAVFVSVGTGSSGRAGSELVEMFLAAGCTGRLVSFYEPGLVEGLEELARLVEETWSRRGRGAGPRPQGDPPYGGSPSATSLEVAEILAVGATETIGFAGAATELAAATAALLNGMLGRRELASPKALPMVSTRNDLLPPIRNDTAGRLLREGTRVVSLECEQRIEVFQDPEAP